MRSPGGDTRSSRTRTRWPGRRPRRARRAAGVSSAPSPGAATTRTADGSRRVRSTSTSASRAGSPSVADDRDLERRPHHASERLEQERERGRVLAEHRGQRRDPLLAARGGVGVAGERGQAEQAVGGERVLGGRGVVLRVLGPHDQRLGVGAGGEEAAALLVGEQAHETVGDGPRLGQPGDVVDLGQREERFEQRGVVLRVREQVGAPVLPRTEQAAVVAAQLARAGTGRWCARPPSSRRARARRPLRRATAGRARSSRAAPCRRGRVGPVARGRRRGAGRTRSTASGRSSVRPDRVEDVAAEAGVRILEVAARGHAEVPHHLGQVVAAEGLELVERPHVEAPSTPSESASSAEKKPPSAWCRSRST